MNEIWVVPLKKEPHADEGIRREFVYDLEIASFDSGVKEKLPHRGIFILTYADG
jgi:hypothetical protein